MTVPAGTFRDVLVCKQNQSIAESIRSKEVARYFAKGVGLVKEVHSAVGREYCTLELVDYNLGD